MTGLDPRELDRVTAGIMAALADLPDLDIDPLPDLDLDPRFEVEEVQLPEVDP